MFPERSYLAEKDSSKSNELMYMMALKWDFSILSARLVYSM